MDIKTLHRRLRLLAPSLTPSTRTDRRLFVSTARTTYFVTMLMEHPLNLF